MSDYERIASVIRYLDEHHREQPDLATLAQVARLSPHHFHRLFARWAGITPKDFLQCLTLEHAKSLLARGCNVLETAHESGLSGPGRLHDLAVTLEAASPGELKSGGANWTIRFGTLESPWGPCLIAEGPRGVCALAFVESLGRAPSEQRLRAQWSAAELEWDCQWAAMRGAQIFRRGPDEGPLRAWVHGSPFQLRVWRALVRVPSGCATTYGRLARAVGQPTAARAVGTAVGRNPLAVLIPCHRVIRETGVAGEYRWGSIRKRALLAWESRPK